MFRAYRCLKGVHKIRGFSVRHKGSTQSTGIQHAEENAVNSFLADLTVK